MRRILYIAHRVPFPPDKGERLRAYHQIQALAQRFDVTVAALACHRQDVAAAEGLRALVRQVHVVQAGGLWGLARAAASLAAGRSITEGYFASRCLLRQVEAAGGHKPFDLAIGYSSGIFPTLLKANARARVMDLIDVDSVKWADYAASAGPLRRWLYRLESRRVAALERRILQFCDAVLLTSPQEAALLKNSAADIRKVLPLGNGVDLAYFHPGKTLGGDDRTIVFTGTMNYRPNIQAVTWFVQAVWPGVRAVRPDAQFVIVGRDPTPAVRRLSREPGVQVTGSVADVRPYLGRACVAVAPLHIARGVQNKVLEAMAMGVAVVASGQALEGLEVTAGGDVLRADTAAQWTAQLRRLLADKNARTSLAHAARKCVETRYSWPSRLAPLVGLAEALMERKSIDPARLSPIEAASAGSLRGIPSVNVAFPAPATLST
jgi:sugar transferase (PEP-CTERM/EpsH1 system associated)